MMLTFRPWRVNIADIIDLIRLFCLDPAAVSKMKSTSPMSAAESRFIMGEKGPSALQSIAALIIGVNVCLPG